MPRHVRTRAACDFYDGTSRILPRYFESYIETICEHRPDKRACVENMVVPEEDRQQEILKRYDEMVHAFPMEDAPSLRYTVMEVLVRGDEELLDKLTTLLGFYTQSVVMLTDAIREIHHQM